MRIGVVCLSCYRGDSVVLVNQLYISSWFFTILSFLFGRKEGGRIGLTHNVCFWVSASWCYSASNLVRVFNSITRVQGSTNASSKRRSLPQARASEVAILAWRNVRQQLPIHCVCLEKWYNCWNGKLSSLSCWNLDSNRCLFVHTVGASWRTHAWLFNYYGRPRHSPTAECCECAAAQLPSSSLITRMNNAELSGVIIVASIV